MGGWARGVRGGVRGAHVDTLGLPLPCELPGTGVGP